MEENLAPPVESHSTDAATTRMGALTLASPPKAPWESKLDRQVQGKAARS